MKSFARFMGKNSDVDTKHRSYFSEILAIILKTFLVLEKLSEKLERLYQTKSEKTSNFLPSIDGRRWAKNLTLAVCKSTLLSVPM